jgi:GNAT superfamily N-acetyltransferase
MSDGGAHQGLVSRLASPHDIPALTQLMNAAITELQRDFLDGAQIESSRAIMKLDIELIEDGTYFVIETTDDNLAGCGGWSKRRDLAGHDGSKGRSGQFLDPAVDAAEVRAMYTHPNFARRGVGRLILELCESAAAQEGFSRLELMATISGYPLYIAYGFDPIERVNDSTGGAAVPLVKMSKTIHSNRAGRT